MIFASSDLPMVTEKFSPFLRDCLSSAAALSSSFSRAIRAVMLSSICPLKLGSLLLAPLSDDSSLVWAAHGTLRVALAATHCVVAGLPRLLCRALLLSCDMVAAGMSRGGAERERVGGGPTVSLTTC